MCKFYFTKFMCVCSSQGLIWLGGNNHYTGGVFVWTDATPFTYTRWYTPISRTGKRPQAVLRIRIRIRFTGSTCFWASRIHSSEFWIRILLWIRIRILLSLCKNSKKNLDSYYFVTLFDFLSLKDDVNVASKSNKQKKLC